MHLPSLKTFLNKRRAVIFFFPFERWLSSLSFASSPDVLEAIKGGGRLQSERSGFTTAK